MKVKLFDQYFNDIRDFEQIDYEKEVKLIYRAQNGDTKAYHKLITSNLRFVITQARKFAHQGLDLIDLVSAGNIGLMKAIERFEPSQGNKLISYAVWWIRQSIFSALANESRIVRLPLNKIGTASKIIRELKKQELGTLEIEAVEVICEKYDLSEYEVVELLNLYAQTNSNFRDEILEENVELIGENFLEEKLDSETKKILAHKIKILDEREQFIASKYFALFGDSWTLEMIGEELDLTRERVRQLKVNILKKLKNEVSKTDFSSKEDLRFPLASSNRKRSSKKFNIVEHYLDYKSDDFEKVDKEEVGLERSKEDITSEKDEDLNEDLLMGLYEKL